MRPSFSRHLLRLVALLVLGHLWYLIWISEFRQSEWIRRLDLLLMDVETRFVDAGEMPSRPRPVVLGLTRRDVKSFGPFPWPRSRWAEIISRLDRAGASKIVLDVFFVSKGNSAPDDEKLVRAIAESGKVLLPVYSSVLIQPSNLEGGGVAVGQIQLNEARIQRSAAGSGHINAFLDVDEKIRFVPIFLRHGKANYYQISLEALRNTETARAFLSDVQVDEEWPGILIDYRGFDNRYEFFSIGELLAGEIGAKEIRGRTVFVGQTTQGLPFADIVSTPIGLRHGIFLLAGIFDQMRSGVILRPLSPLTLHFFFYFLCVGSVLMSGFLNQRLRILLFFVVPATLFLAHLALFERESLVFPFTAAVLAGATPMVAAFVGSDFYFRFSARRALERAEKLSNIGRMAGMIAHDIRNPLAIIRGQAQALLGATGLSVQSQENLMSIDRQTRRIAMMLEDLLDYSTGQIKVERTETNLTEVLRNARREIERDMASPNSVTIEFTCADPEAKASLDPIRFYRVLENLAKNSIQAMPDGGRIHWTLESEAHEWALRVRDHGTGIPPEVRSRLFEPFNTSGKKTGIGLGLAIVRQIVLVHEGRIELESSGPEGTVFVIHLPKSTKQ